MGSIFAGRNVKVMISQVRSNPRLIRLMYTVLRTLLFQTFCFCPAFKKLVPILFHSQGLSNPIYVASWLPTYVRLRNRRLDKMN